MLHDTGDSLLQGGRPDLALALLDFDAALAELDAQGIIASNA
jgi:hypothetical protein